MVFNEFNERRRTYVDIVIIDERGLAIVIELKDSTRKDINKSATEGYDRYFNKIF